MFMGLMGGMDDASGWETWLGVDWVAPSAARYQISRITALY